MTKRKETPSVAAALSAAPAGPVTEAEFHVWEQAGSDPAVMDQWLRFWTPHLQGARRILDVACGEGDFLGALLRAGYEAEGVDLTPTLVERARAKGRSVHEEDAVAFVEREGGRYDTFFVLDFIEHLPFSVATRLLSALPSGARVIIVTPNTNSVIGHQFFLQVPSHAAPYSPFVLRRMLERGGFDTLTEGTLYGGLPWTGLRRRITEWFLVRLLGTTTAQLLIEGANFYVVARKR